MRVTSETQGSVGSFSQVISEQKQNSSISLKITGSKRNSAKKKLIYNHRDISSQLLKAGKPQNASIALIRARDKLAVLKRCKATGDYDEKEVMNAINHAQKIIRCAKLKMNHLKEEEQLKERSKLARRVEHMEAKQRELIARRKKNRFEEQGKICEADSEYQKERNQSILSDIGNTNASEYKTIDSGVILELSAQESQVPISADTAVLTPPNITG